jgi:threonine dehydrogenase-like Zn-dependent dehydrogenase
MRAIAATPGEPSSACLLDAPEPGVELGSVLAQTLAIGICGTDVEIASGRYGWSPPGRERLVIGHESIGRVLEAPEGSSFTRGDLIVGVVRRPDPVPCRYCAVGEWDMCHRVHWGHPVIADVITRSAPSGIVCLTGVSSGGHAIGLDLGNVNRSMVLENDVVFGSVNANRAHYEAGAVALARTDRAWLSALITRRVPLADRQDARDRRPHDVKVIVEFDVHA